ncbi:MAG: hypothetical protein R3E56_02630 [Burkholderiaceae bacterium]
MPPRVSWVHISRIHSPMFTRLAIGVWRLFTDLDLSEAVPQR